MPYTEQKPNEIPEDDIQEILKHLVKGFGYPQRSPILHRPDEAGLIYENVSFPSLDGVPIEGWFIPREGSDKIIIANHPLTFSRAGYPGHIEPWKSAFGDTGNDFEVNFIPDLKILHEAGYAVLTYDFRNFGQSGSANGGIQSAGIYEARDVIGSLRYIRSRPDTSAMRIGLLSRCLGADASMFAMEAYQEEFEDVRCMVAPQPLSVRVIIQRTLEHLGIPDRIDEFEFEQKLITSFSLDEMSPVKAAKSVCVPSFIYQVHDDLLTHPSDVQAIYDNIPTQKKLHWIRGTTRRWDGYCYFQREPAQALEWFAAYMD